MNIGSRVLIKNRQFLGEGEIVKITGNEPFMSIFVIRLDNKAPNEYAYDTYEVIAFEDELIPVTNTPQQNKGESDAM